MRLLYHLLIIRFFLQVSYARIFNGCRFVETFYKTHSNIFELDKDQISLIVRPLYELSNQSFSSINQSLSIGIIYRLADIYLVPIPLIFKCPQNEHIYTPIDCEFTIIDTRSDLSIRTSESTRTSTVPLYFQEYSSYIPLRGAYFKQSTIALRNCRLNTKENLFISETFYLHIEFEQIINSSCQKKCLHSQLYQCSALSNTCQCHSNENGIEKFGHLCIDTELGTNCSLTSERCRRICRISEQVHTGKIDLHCQCPLGTQRILSNNIYHCELPILSECNHNESIVSCPKDYIQTSILVRINQSILSLPFILIGLLIGAFLIIFILILSLLKMRSIKSIKFVHSHMLSIHSNNSSSCSILSSKSVKLSSTNKISEKYTKINLYE